MKRSDGFNIIQKSLAPVSGTPIVEVCGKHRVLLENHCGLDSYECDRICVKVKFGQICIHGRNLKIVKLCRERIVINGMIAGVDLLGCD